ncbi:MAG TPA: discoidin domain-containing protein [Candidatus Dormibacteraeota bacterium]|nr:discoidin domain-containing protein [Candidatus Dormibacteraeota bacterium]
MTRSPVNVLALLVLTACSAHCAVTIPTQKGDNGRSGLTPSETILTLQNVNSTNFGLLFKRTVSGDMYPQPLIVSGLTIGGGTHNVVYLATAANNVYAYDADDASISNPYWTKNLGTPVPATDVDCCCSDIASVVGVIGTPAIDSSSQTMYLVAKNKNTDGTYHQWLHALDLITGAEKFGGPVEIVSAGNFDPKLNNQRPGLLLQAGNVYIGWASHNDCGAYHGVIAAYNASTLAQVAVWNDTPTGTQAGIWMSGGGLVGDGTHIYFSTGNGDFNASSGGANYGESIVGLDNSLHVVTYYTPSGWSRLNGHDLDLGGCGLLLIPGTRLLVTGGKDQHLHLVNADNMGGLAGGLQDFDDGNGHNHGGPVAFNSPAGLLVYIQPEGTALEAYKMVNGLFSPTTPYWTSPVPPPTGMPGGQMWVSGTGASAVLWETVPFSADANHATVAGILRAFDPSTGIEIYNSHQNQTRDDYGNFAKNPSPVVANGKVYVSTFSGWLAVYGLGATNAPPPPTPLSQGQTATASSQQHGNAASAGNDGSLSTRWSANNGGFPQWWKVDLGASHSLTNVTINWYNSASRYYQYRIETSPDDVTYTTAVDKTGNTNTGDTSDPFTATARYVRVTITFASTSGWASLYECKVYGN